MGSTPDNATTWEQVIPNCLPELMRAIDGLEAFLNTHEASPETLYAARLAAEEMGTNIIKYSYDDTRDHRITLRVHCLEDQFQLELIDDGHEFDPTLRPDADPDLPLEDRNPGGWGISLIRSLTQDLDYRRDAGQNILTVRLARP